MKHQARELALRFRRSPQRDTVTIVALAVVLLSGMAAFAPSRDDDPAMVVSEFLTASKRGDVDRALELAGQHPKGDKAAFLTPKAAASDWSIDRIKTAIWDETPSYDNPEDGDSEDALVEFDIEIPGRSNTSGSIELTRKAGENWKLTEPLSKTTIPYTPLWYNEVNGERVKAMDPSSKSSGQDYLLLPGVYTLGSDVGDLVDVSNHMTPVFPQQQSRSLNPVTPDPKEFSEPKVRLTAAGRTAVEKEVKARIDDCAAKNEPETYGCPFSADPVDVETADGHYLDDVSDVSWKVEEYPEIAVVAGSESFDVTDRRRGSVTLKVKSENDQKVHCEIRTSDLELGFTQDGSIRIEPDEGRFQKREQAIPGEFETCDS